MVIDISVKAFALFCAQFIVWGGLCTLMAFFVYWKDDPGPYSKLHHIIYGTLVTVAFVLIFGFIQINWLP